MPVVDLPQPDSPTSPSVSPSRIQKLTPSTACTFGARARSSPVLGREMLAQLLAPRAARRPAGAAVAPGAPSSDRGFRSTPPNARARDSCGGQMAAALPARTRGAIAFGQRGANRQPGMLVLQRRHHAGNLDQPRPAARRAADLPRCGIEPSRPRVYGMARPREELARPALPRPCAPRTSRRRAAPSRRRRRGRA